MNRQQCKLAGKGRRQLREGNGLYCLSNKSHDITDSKWKWPVLSLWQIQRISRLSLKKGTNHSVVTFHMDISKSIRFTLLVWTLVGLQFSSCLVGWISRNSFGQNTRRRKQSSLSTALGTGIRKASLLLGGREKRLGRNRPPQNGVIGGSVALSGGWWGDPVDQPKI